MADKIIRFTDAMIRNLHLLFRIEKMLDDREVQKLPGVEQKIDQ